MLKNYLKIAVKVLLRRKFFTFVSLFAISFTLVLLVVVAALVDNSFGPRAPETKLDRTVGIFRAQIAGDRGRRTAGAGYRLLDEVFRDLPGADETAAFTYAGQVHSYRDGEKLGVYLKRADGGFWRVFDFEFLEGAPYTAEDERAAAPVAVVNASTRARFFGDGPAVGQSIDLGGRSYRVVGVVSDVPYFRALTFSDVWTPISAYQSGGGYRADLVGEFNGVALARSADDVPALRREIDSRVAGVQTHDKDYPRLSARAESFLEFTTRMLTGGEGGGAPIAVFAATASVLALLVMLLPAVNLVNINVSRILERASEIGVRKAFGASSRTLVGQFVVENVVLTLVGGALALALSFGLLAALNASQFFPYSDLRMSYRVLLAGLVVTLFFGLFSGVYPAWKMSRLNPVEALRGRSS